MKKLIPKRLYHRIDTLKRYRPVSLAQLQTQFAAVMVESDELLHHAKRLHADTYVRHGYFDPTDINDSGHIHHDKDPYQHHAQYFAVVDNEGDVVAVARQIHHQTGSTSLPVFDHLKLDKEYRHLHPSQIVELSAFAKRPGADSRALILLFREMLKHSKDRQHRYWLMAVDTTVYARLKTLFGPVIRKIGPETFYLGSNVVPAEIDIDMAPRYLKQGYRRTVPPLRNLRKFLYSSFTEPEERRARTSRSTPRSVFWDQYARSYDGLLEFAPYVHLIDHISDKVIAQKPRRVLDLGCGTGNVAGLLLRKDPSLVVDAVDWSEQMLNQLRTKPYASLINIFQRDILMHLKRTRKKYDVIVMNNVLYTISEREVLWDLLAKRLNDGGSVVLANPYTGNSKALLKDHVAVKGATSLLKSKLLKVWLFDIIISTFGLARSYDFTSRAELIGQLHRHHFRLVGEVETCYGGHKEGIDLLLTAQKTQK